ncbi:MAG: DUF4424 family protein [Holophagaceae bacterium]|nr:DUF4424 family protein [Holophagaceae bacterium]
MNRWLIIPLLLASCAALPAARRNDGAAETAAGGLRLRRERSVAMVKERLTIGPKRVRVEYEFRNDTDKDVVTEVAFPIPEYEYPGEDPGGERGFKDFRVWIDGAPRRFQTEARAFVKEREVTAELKAAGLAIESFAGFCHWDLDVRKAEYQVDALPEAARAELVAAGILGEAAKDDPGWSFMPNWRAKVTYHWTQRFPAKTTVKIAHEYTPVAGFGFVEPAKLAKEHPDAGADAALVKALTAMAAKREAAAPTSGAYVSATWVKYILTTANTWKTPIEDFELRIEKPEGGLVSLDWGGPVERLPGGILRASKKKFTPTKELSVYFFRP